MNESVHNMALGNRESDAWCHVGRASESLTKDIYDDTGPGRQDI